MPLLREFKAYCPDFTPLRRALIELGAVFLERKTQVDYYFNLRGEPEIGRTRRLKLRLEKGGQYLVYYQEVGEGERRARQYEVAEAGSPGMMELMKAALGVRAVVRKEREVWRKGNTLFNLDTVEGVGQVFEVEALTGRGEQRKEAAIDYFRQGPAQPASRVVDSASGTGKGEEVEREMAELGRLLGPYLGERIEGSNEDLVAGKLTK
jgi:adenylate cyclase class IV